MPGATAELQGAIFAALTADAVLTGLLGGAKVYDHAPPHVAFPYVTLGRWSAFDWSTATERGREHYLTVHVWSKGFGKKQAAAIMDAIEGVLDDASLALDTHHLVGLRLEDTDLAHDDDLAVHHGLMRFRAVSEPA